jgi:hypothetical protein
MSTRKKQPTRAELLRRNMELEAQLAYVYHFAAATLDKAGDCLKASGVLVQMHALGGRQIIPPVVIRDGFSADTLAAIRRDLVRSYESAIAFKPKGAV